MKIYMKMMKAKYVKSNLTYFIVMLPGWSIFWVWWCQVLFPKKSLTPARYIRFNFNKLRWLKLKRYGGFLKYGYPQIIRFNRLFHYKCVGTTIYGNLHIPFTPAGGFSCHPSLCDFGAMRCPPLWPQQHEQHVAVYPAKGRSTISDVLIDQ